jgi:hypothetical protein
MYLELVAVVMCSLSECNSDTDTLRIIQSIYEHAKDPFHPHAVNTICQSSPRKWSMERDSLRQVCPICESNKVLIR